MIGLIDTSVLTNIADAIRGKLGVQTAYKPNEMPEAIESISGGGITPTGTKSITANGTYDAASYASAEVNVPSVTPTGTKQISITANGTTTEDVASYADAQISVNVPTGITPTGTKQVSITSNGTTTEDVTAYANAQITVNVVNQDYEDALVALGVTEDLTDGIEALTAYANTVTGESDTTLSDAVASLADGYGGGGGSGLEYEEGTYTATGDSLPTINFANSHTKEPSIVVFMKTNTSETMPNNCGTFFVHVKADDIFGSGLQTGAGLFRNNIYAQAHTSGSGSTSLSAAINTDNTNPIITSSSFKPYFSSTTYVCKTGETYKWIAIWK